MSWTRERGLLIEMLCQVDFVVTQSQVTKNEAERQLPRAGNNASQKQGEGLRLFGPGSDIALEDDRL